MINNLQNVQLCLEACRKENECFKLTKQFRTQFRTIRSDSKHKMTLQITGITITIIFKA